MIPLRDERMAVVCAPHHPLARARTVTAQQLQPYSMVGFEPELPVSRALVRYLRAHGVRPQVAEAFDNIDTIKSAIASGDRIAILPQRTVLREAEAGTLAIVELRPRLERPLGIVYPRGTTLSLAASRFAEFLVRHAGPVDEGSPAELVDPRPRSQRRSAPLAPSEGPRR
jgi:DNA-binding transcriptional LysR family regulator